MSGDSRAPATGEEVAERLRELPGVKAVDASRLPARLVISSDPAGARALTAGLLAPVLKSEYDIEPEISVEIGSPAGQTGTRVRFDSLEILTNDPGRVTARLTLEWNGRKYDGESSAESGPVGALRASGTAAAKALGSVVDDESTFALVGIKEVHVFDHDVVAVLLHSPKLPDRRLIGLSIIGDDRHRAAVFAVLNATNRAVGNLSGSGAS